MNADTLAANSNLQAERDRLDATVCGKGCGRFVLDEPIARGGFSTVYRAHAADAPDDAVAVKLLNRDVCLQRGVPERFALESQTMLEMRHPAIVTVLDAGFMEDVSGPRPYIAMEFLAGGTLERFWRQRARLTLDEALVLLEQICAGLEHVHARGVVHRDLKASNIGLVRADDLSAVKLLDFGVAKLLAASPSGPALTAVGQRIGTPIAMSPEQIRGAHIDHRSDIYSLGIMLFRLLTGMLPCADTTWEALERFHLKGRAPEASSLAPVPPAISRVVARCLEKRPEDRFSSAAELLAEFRAGVRERPPETAAPGTADGAIMLAVRAYSQEQSGGSVSDESFAAIAQVLDEAECRMQDAGLIVTQQTGDSVSGLIRAGATPAARLIEVAQGIRDFIGELGFEELAAFQILLAPVAAEIRTVNGTPVVSGPVGIVAPAPRTGVTAAVARSVLDESTVPDGFGLLDG